MGHCFICRHRSDSITDDLIDIPFHSVSHDLLQMPWLKSIQEFSFQSVTTCRICNGKALEIIELSQKIKSLQFDLQRSRQEINRTLISQYGPPGEYLDPMERLGRMIAQIQSECSVQIDQTDPVYPVVSLKEFDADVQVNFDTRSEAESPPGSPWLPEVNEGSNQECIEDENEPDPQSIPTAKPKKRRPVRRADINEKKDLSVNCPHCGLTFQKPTALIIHMRFKHPDPGKAPPKRNKRREIDKNEKKDISVNCPHCDLTFQKPTALIIHMRFKHRDPEEVRLDLKCPQCDKTFASKRCRDNHIAAIHDKTTKFVCDICGQSFASRSRLSNHLIYSHADKTLKCSFCDHKFKTKWQLKHHEDRHSGQPSYVCEICGKAFYHLEALSRHKNSTHSTKSASCPQCGKVFQSIKHVRGHITRTHKQMWRKWVATAREKARKSAEGSSRNNEEENGDKVNEERNRKEINEERNRKEINEERNRKEINEERNRKEINEVPAGHEANIFHWKQWQPTQN